MGYVAAFIAGMVAGPVVLLLITKKMQSNPADYDDPYNPHGSC